MTSKLSQVVPKKGIAFYAPPATAAQITDSTADGRTLLTSTKANQLIALSLDQVNNTSDANKPVSTATTSAINNAVSNYLQLAGGTLTGNVTISSTGNLTVSATTNVASLTASGSANFNGGLSATSVNTSSLTATGASVLSSTTVSASNPLLKIVNTGDSGLQTFYGATYGSVWLGFTNTGSSASSTSYGGAAVAAGATSISLGLLPGGKVGSTTNTSFGSNNLAFRNLLDDGAGNMTVKLNINAGGGVTSSGGPIINNLNSGTGFSTAFVASPAGGAQGLQSGLQMRATFVGTGDNGIRRCADIYAGFNGGSWGSETLYFGVGYSSAGTANDAANVSTTRATLDSNGNLSIVGSLIGGSVPEARITSPIQSLASTTGYRQLPGGLIIQYAILTQNSKNQTWTYPVAFPNAVISVQATPLGTTTGGSYSAWVNTLSTSSATIESALNNSQSIQTIYAIAIGY